MTEEQLAEIEARANAATPGPWGGVVISQQWLGDRYGDPHLGLLCFPETCDLEDPDHEFIRKAREDVPALIAALRHAQGEQEWLKGELLHARKERDEFGAQLTKAERYIESLESQLRTEEDPR